jgi:hypothetical protein
LHALILDPPEAFMGNCFTTYGGCGPCFSLSYSDLVHPYFDFYLLGPTDLLPQELGLVIKEFIQGDEVGNYMVQKVFLVAASFQVSHVGLPDWVSDGGGLPHRCGDEVFLVDLAQVAEGFSEGQGVGVSVSKPCSVTHHGSMLG